MKKSFFLGELLAFCIILLLNLNFNKPQEEKNQLLNWQDNILIRFDEQGAHYETITDYEINDLNVSSEGLLETYNISKNIFVFLKNHNNEYNLDIYIGKKLIESIKLSGDLEDVQISPKGEYILFKSKNDINYRLFNIKENKSISISEEILPSGNMIKFLDDGQLICYGVREKDKINAIFTYDPQEDKYNLIKEIDGFVSYIDTLRDYEVLLLETNNENKKELFKLNIKTKKVDKLSEEIDEIDDGEYLDNKYYFLGRKRESEETIYSYDIGNKKLNRLAFNFPENINASAGMEVIGGQIYFDGYEKRIDEGSIYRFNPKDNSVTLVNGDEGKYMILERADKSWNLSAFLC